MAAALPEKCTRFELNNPVKLSHSISFDLDFGAQFLNAKCFLQPTSYVGFVVKLGY